MARRPRHNFPGAYYHVTTRGNNRGRIQWGPGDCVVWELLLGHAARRHTWEVLTYCLLENHFHLVLYLPEAGLSEGMQWLNGAFARQMNKRHRRIDHLFGRRFWSKPIGTNDYLKKSLHYVAWNPVRAGLAASPDEYRWSGHRALAGLAHPPSFLAVGRALGAFDEEPVRARAAYRRYIRDSSVMVPGTVTEL
jgi:REP element-mobilizing transposase RayT